MDLVYTRRDEFGASEHVLRPVTVPRALSTICVIDNDGQTRRFFDLCVRHATSSVLEFYPNCTSFLLKRRPVRFGCVLIDPQPGASGVEMLETMCTGLPVIVMTRRPTVALAVRALQAGAVDFIEKPLNRDRVLAGISRALEPRHFRNFQGTRTDGEDCDNLYGLTTRQRQILNLMMGGLASKIIAADLGLSQRTVERHRADIMRKFNCRSMAGLVKKVYGLPHAG